MKTRRWPFYAIILLVIALVVGLRELTDRPAPVTEVLVEESMIVQYRIYIDTREGDVFFLYAGETDKGSGFKCLVDRDEYLRAYVGAPALCVWRPL